MIFRIKPSECERRAGKLDSGALKEGLRRFQSDGALVFDEILDAELIQQARSSFLERYEKWLDTERPGEMLQVGDRRIMVTVELTKPFDDERLIVNPWLVPILVDVLGGDYVLDSFGVVCSLPGAKRQCPHRDGGMLFPEVGINNLLPTVAVTVAIPLLEMNHTNGTTELWLGSHRNFNCDKDSESVKPVVPEGSGALWDFRLLHSGTENYSELPRPLLYLTYSRPWFVDNANFGKKNPKQRRLLASPEFVCKLPDRNMRIFSRARWQY
jgi:ectoine hydroxylase-related dioxygenase (phytanoyl-CoA dioxygenase family)